MPHPNLLCVNHDILLYPRIPNTKLCNTIFVLCLLCHSCLALQYYSTQQYPLSHPRLSRPALLLYPTVYSLAWREHWHVWSTKQIPQQASLFPVESPGLGGMLTLHYSTPPRTQCPRWTTRLYLFLLGSGLCLSLSLALPLCSYDILTVPSSHLPPSHSLHTCAIDRISGLLYELTWWHGVNRQIRVCFRPETVTL